MSEESLRDTAEATGGRVIFTPLGPGSTIGLLDRMDGVYTLGIEVLASDTPRSRVKVKLPHRKGRIQVGRHFPAPRRSRSTLLATLDALPPAPDGDVRVTLKLDLSKDGLERGSADRSEPSRLAIYARIRASNGLVFDDDYQIIEVLMSAEGPQLFTHVITFSAPPGEYMVELSVSDLVGHGQASVTVGATQPLPR